MTTHRVLSYELIRAFRQLRNVHWRGREPIDGSTKGETIMLFVLYRAMKNGSTGLKASELSRALRVAMPSATQMVNVLEAKGLLERCPDPSDRRVVRIRLTDAGRTATEAAESAMIDGMSELIEHLGMDRTAQLIEMLDEVSRFFEDREPGNVCTPPLFDSGSQQSKE